MKNSHIRTDPEFHMPFADDDLTSDPPPRASLPSISELALVRHERRKIVPSLPPPPHKDPRQTAGSITMARQRMREIQAHAVLF